MTRKALAVHQYRRHQWHAPEWRLATSATCGACLKYFWTRAHLHKHLADLPRGGGGNPCFEKLRKYQFETPDPQFETVPSRFAGLNRLEAIPTAGPSGLGLSIAEQRHQRWSIELRQVEHALAAMGFSDHFDAALDEDIFAALSAVTEDWFHLWRADYPHGPDGSSLQGDWLLVLSATPAVEAEAFFSFLRWSEELHITSPGMTEKQLTSLRMHTPSWQETWSKTRFFCAERASKSFWCNLLRIVLLPLESQLMLIAHYGSRPKMLVKGDFVILSAPECRVSTSASCCTYALLGAAVSAPPKVVHLFSGHRQYGDVHHWLWELSQQRGFDLTILSLDTAVSQVEGDLRACTAPGHELEQLYSHGLLAVTIAGSPRETFSEARFMQVFNALGH